MKTRNILGAGSFLALVGAMLWAAGASALPSKTNVKSGPRIVSGNIVDYTIQAADLDTGAVTALVLADESITAADIDTGAVTSSEILDGTIVNADVNASAGIVYSKLTFSNNIVSGDIATGGVTGTDILDKTINLADMDTSSVDSTTLLDESVTSGDILDGTLVNADVNASAAVAYSKLNLTGAIVTGDITDKTIALADMDTASVDSVVILDESVTSTDVLNGTLVNADLNASAAVAYSKLNLTGAVVTGDITDKTIALADMDTSSVDSVVILDESVTSADVLDGTLVNADVNASAAIAYSKLAFSDNIVAGDIATNAVTTTEINDGTIANVDVDASAAIVYTKLAFSDNIVAGDIATGAVTTTEVLDYTLAAADIDTGAVVSLTMGQGTSTLDTNVDTPMGLMTFSWNASSEDGDNDIFITTNAPAMEIVDIWSVCSTAEGGARTLTLRDASNGAGNAISSALDCNATTVQRTTALTSNVLAAADTIAGNFDGAVGTAAGTVYIAYRRAP